MQILTYGRRAGFGVGLQTWAYKHSACECLHNVVCLCCVNLLFLHISISGTTLLESLHFEITTTGTKLIESPHLHYVYVIIIFDLNECSFLLL